MGETIKVEGYDAFAQKLEELKDKSPLFIVFSGSKDTQTGIYLGTGIT